MGRLLASVASLLLAVSSWGCFDLPDTSQLLPVGTPFVVRGTMTVDDSQGPCLVWAGENGVYYHLFQSPLLANQTFDRITTPGVTSRLVVATRSDLVFGCRLGTVVEVRDVLEIAG